MFFNGSNSSTQEQINSLNDTNTLHYANQYQPYRIHGEKNADFNDFSRLILDVKDMKDAAITKFANYFIKMNVRDGVVICAVPSHDPAKKHSGVHAVIDKICGGCNAINGGHVLYRHVEVAKLATGGDRSKNVHLNSIAVADVNLVRGHNLILMDDVTTSGNSIEACKDILLANGANAVKMFAFSKTAGS